MVEPSYFVEAQMYLNSKVIPTEIVNNILGKYSDGITYSDLIQLINLELTTPIPPLELLFMLKGKIADGEISAKRIISSPLPRAFTQLERQVLVEILRKLVQEDRKVSFKELAAMLIEQSNSDFTLNGMVQKLMFILMPLCSVIEEEEEEDAETTPSE